MSERERTCSEELYSTFILIKEVRAEVQGALTLLDSEIKHLKESGHLPTYEQLDQWGYNMSAHVENLEGNA